MAESISRVSKGLKMQAIELERYGGPESLRLTEFDRPRPGEGEVLIEVRASGINFAELELTWGRYKIPKTPPFVMGFEAAGVVAEVGGGVTNVSVGDRVASIVSTGGFAEFAVAPAAAMIPIPAGVSFEEATTIPIQGVTAYLLLTAAARLRMGETILIQSAAGGVGLYLVQLAKHVGAGRVIALAGKREKLPILRDLGADVALDYSEHGWTERVIEATQGRGVDILLESATGELGQKSMALCAPFGRVILYGALNVYEALSAEAVAQVIYKNQSIAGFNLPSMRPDDIAEAVPPLLELIRTKAIKIKTDRSFAFSNAREGFERLAGRDTVGKVILIPDKTATAYRKPGEER